MQYQGMTRIQCEYGETIHIKPIADVHYGHKMCDTKAFINFMQDSDDHTYFIGVGDLLDSIVVQDFRYRKSMDTSEGDDILNEQVDAMCAILEPYKDKILQLSIGNHEATIIRKCSFNPIREICKRLSVPYAGTGWIYTLRMRGKSGGGRTVYIRGHHGWGGGSRTQGADITKFARDTNYYDCDIFLYGHVHKRQYDEIPRLGVSGSNLVARPKSIVICGTFQKTMSDGVDDTWAESVGFAPVPIGGMRISIKPMYKKWCDVKVERA